MLDIYQGFEPDEIRTLAQILRLKESLLGDPEFRRIACESHSERASTLSDLGIDINLKELEPIWKLNKEGNKTSLSESELVSYPVLKLWAKWKEFSHIHACRLAEEWQSTHNRPLAAWRKRQTHRLKSEIGQYRKSTMKPLFAYELSKGCSVNCWFCCFSAEKFRSYFPYTKENGRFWQDILKTGLDLFGSACKSSVCYHATEPFDNPDYLHFLRDFNHIYGVLPQTTTAVPLKNIELTREMMRLRKCSPTVYDRFSILSLNSLKQIQETFSPYELRHVRLELLNKGALIYKTNSGRARGRSHQLVEANNYASKFDQVKNPTDPLTSDCVCGYLVNLVEQTVKLISPCMATDQWPNGYRVHAETTFRDTIQYREFLEQTVKEHMYVEIDWNDKVSFRCDLKYERLEKGFTLTSRFYRHAMKGKSWYGALGNLISEGKSSTAEIITGLVSEGAPFLEADSTMQNIFEKGLLNDDPSIL